MHCLESSSELISLHLILCSLEFLLLHLIRVANFMHPNMELPCRIFLPLNAPDRQHQLWLSFSQFYQLCRTWCSLLSFRLASKMHLATDGCLSISMPPVLVIIISRFNYITNSPWSSGFGSCSLPSSHGPILCSGSLSSLTQLWWPLGWKWLWVDLIAQVSRQFCLHQPP